VAATAVAVAAIGRCVNAWRICSKHDPGMQAPPAPT
jgi:hypothetical protein